MDRTERAKPQQRPLVERVPRAARAQFDVVHRYPTNDFTIDTVAVGPDEVAAAVHAALRSPASAVDDLVDAPARTIG